MYGEGEQLTKEVEEAGAVQSKGAAGARLQVEQHTNEPIVVGG